MRKVLFILSELSDADLDWMAHNGTKKTVPRGTVLIEEGKPIELLYIVLDGQLSVSIAAMDNKPIATLQAGAVVGELSFLDSRPPAASVSATDEATVLAIRRSLLTAKLDDDSGFAARFYRALGVFLSARLRKTLGYGRRDADDDEVEPESELDPELLQNVALAGARFDWLLNRLRGASGEG